MLYVNPLSLLLPMLLMISYSEKVPDCAGAEHYAANMTVGKLRNAGLFRSAEDLKSIKSKILMTQRLGSDLYQQLFEVTLFLKDGHIYDTLVISDATFEECSISDPKIFLISDKF